MGHVGSATCLDLRMEMPMRQVESRDWNELEKSTPESPLPGVGAWLVVPVVGLPGLMRGHGGGGRGRGSEIEVEEPPAGADSEQPVKQEEPPAALGLLEAKRNRKPAAGSRAAKRSSQVRREHCPLGLATWRSWVTLTPADTTELEGGGGRGNLVGIRGHRGEVIENSNSGGLSRMLLQRGAKRDAGGQPGEEVVKRGFRFVFLFNGRRGMFVCLWKRSW